MSAANANNATNDETNRYNNRKYLIVTAFVFLIPFLAAYLMHATGWYKATGTTNHGILIEPPIPFQEIADTSVEPLWWMVFVMPDECSNACRNGLFQMRQIHRALGPDQERVARMIITTKELPAEYRALIAQEFPHLKIVTSTPQKLSQAFQSVKGDPKQPAGSGQIYLVDTMGAVFIYYPTYEDEQQSILRGRDLLQDLRKVLKLSKIG